MSIQESSMITIYAHHTFSKIEGEWVLMDSITEDVLLRLDANEYSYIEVYTSYGAGNFFTKDGTLYGPAKLFLEKNTDGEKYIKVNFS